MTQRTNIEHQKGLDRLDKDLHRLVRIVIHALLFITTDLNDFIKCDLSCKNDASTSRRKRFGIRLGWQYRLEQKNNYT